MADGNGIKGTPVPGATGILSTDTSQLQYPVRGYRFTVQFGSLGISSWREVNGFGMTADSPTYREGGFASLTVRKLPGLISYDDITLSKGVYNSTLVYDYFKGYMEGNNKIPVDVTITVYDNASTAQASWRAVYAWPTHYESSGLNAESSDILVESLTLAHEGLERIAV